MDYSMLFLSTISSLAFLGLSADPGASLPCMKKLLPCQPYLHSPSPPASCCVPLKGMVEDDGDCLCQFVNNPTILKSLNLTRDDALKLPKACGSNPDTSVCKNAATPPTSPVPPSPSTSSNNPSGSGGGSTAKNAANGISYFGGYGFVGLLVALFVSVF